MRARCAGIRWRPLKNHGESVNPEATQEIVDAASGRLAELVYTNAKPLSLFGLIAAAGTLLVCWRAADALIMLVWLGAMVLLYGALFVVVLVRRRRNFTPSNARKALQLLSVLTTLAGIAWGIFGATVAIQGPVERAGFVAFAVGALTAGKLSLCQGYLPASLGFVTTALLPTGVALLINGAEPQLYTGIMTLLAWGLFVATALPLRRRMIVQIQQQVQLEAMRSMLDERRDQVEKLNVAVRGLQARTDTAEADVRRLSADFGLAEGKARALADTLQRTSLVCPETGLGNARAFHDALAVEWRRAMRARAPLTLLLIEVDEFASFCAVTNANTIETLAKRLAKGLRTYGRRPGDFAGRIDRGRFVLLLPSCAARNGFCIADTYRERVAGLQVPRTDAGSQQFVTIHIGVATMIPARNSEAGVLMERAESAAFEAAFQEGNRTVLFRTLDKLKLEHWNPLADGPLNGETMRQKLMILGFEPKRLDLGAKGARDDHAYERETVIAPLRGELKVEIEGQTLTLKPGAWLHLPAGVTHSLELEGKDPAVIVEATSLG